MPKTSYLLLATIASIVAPLPAGASVIGSLANFDVVNDTGKPAYGFEIEIEDPGFDHTKIQSVFGYDRVFPSVSPDPGAVVRFGKPVITDVPGSGVKITYGGTIGSVFTPSAPYNTPGESCWPGANPGWQSTSCDHYGVSTTGQPLVTKYRWLVESAPGSGTLVAQQVGIPAVNFAYTPPAPPPAPGEPAVPGVVNAVIHAVAPNLEQPENVDLWGEPFWVKIFTTKVPHEIDLGDLLRGDPDQEAAEVETEWTIFQLAPAGHEGANEMKEKELEVAEGDKAIVRRYEFYKYAGLFNVDGSGEVLCDGAEAPDHRCDSPFGNVPGIDDLGDYVGSQMAGVNFDVVPEPGTGTLLITGFAGLAFAGRRRKGT